MPDSIPDPEKQVELYDTWIKQGGDYDKETTGRGWQVPTLVYEELEPNLVEGQRLLDIGSGSGLSAEPFKEAGLAMRGIDGSTELLKVANEKQIYSLGTEKVLIGRDEVPATHDYDYAISLGTMSIIPSAKRDLLETMQKSVKPEGIIAFNYLDLEDYDDVDIDQTENGEYVDKKSASQQKRFFHTRDDILSRCKELDLTPIKEIEAVSYPHQEEGKQNPTRIMIARYSP